MDIETIRQLAKEQGVDLGIQGLVCLPRELKKYIGFITRYQKKGGGATYMARIRYENLKSNVTFDTEVAADQYIRNFNVREGLPIRNKFIIFEDRVEVELSKGKTLICDIDDLYLVELHIWYYTCGYVATCISRSTTKHYFHNAVMKHIPTHITVDHINLNKLDNRKINLRLVDRQIQNINRGMNSNNKSGVTGVCYDKRSNYWMATWQDRDRNQLCKCFSSKKYGNKGAKAKAIEHRQRMIRSLPHYREALRLDAEA